MKRDEGGKGKGEGEGRRGGKRVKGRGQNVRWASLAY